MTLSEMVATTVPAGNVTDITVADLMRVARMFPDPPERMVVVTPSLEALRAYCALVPDHAPAFEGLEVYVARFADRPMLAPRGWVRSHHAIPSAGGFLMGGGGR